ncbi:glycosyl transferase family 36 [Rhodanobacter sp. 115]|uniref:GH36-type glycosyl hydrolase domain-containing protein n=1 Tax=Rhodanobacter sp. FW021-MT20 TaxID=1162282 RepID=UPI0034E45E3B
MSSQASSRVNVAHPVQWLSNGSYSAFLDASGSGGSHWRGQAVTRWHENPVGHAWGSFIFLRDEHSGETWSATQQPCGGEAEEFAVDFHEGSVRVQRCHDTLESVLDVAVAGEHDVELRRITLTNHGDRPRTITLTSYAELVLGPAGADASHPAFSKMFVQTEWVEQGGVLLATRRKRSSDEPSVWAAHMLLVDGQDGDTHEFESSRLRFLGRGHVLRDAHAMRPGIGLSNSSGCVLDPVFSLRRGVTLAPGASVKAMFWTALADSRESVLSLLPALRVADAADQLLRSAQAHAASRRQQQDIDVSQAAHFDGMIGPLLRADSHCRAPAEVVARGHGGAPVLWGSSISGDRPIVLLHVADEAGLASAHELLRAQRYWQSKRLACDVVMLGAADQHDALAKLAKAQNDTLKAAKNAVKAECFALDDAAIDASVRDGLRTVARIELDAAKPWPAADYGRQSIDSAPTGRAPIPRAPTRESPDENDTEAREFDNGLGGFVDGGRSYAISLKGEQRTPMPWVNVMANADFGCLVSAEGGGYTWSINSQQNALTPWPNDSVADMPHEALYLRDEDGGEVWSATASPIRVPSARYRTVHGKGWSRFTHRAHDIEVELLQCVPSSGSLKLSRLRLRNGSAHARHLTVTSYVEWALGPNGAVTTPYVVTSRDESTGAMFARNAWREEFGERVAFIDLGGQGTTCSGDRREVLGQHGDVGRPDGLIRGEPLSGHTGAGLDPCGALQTRIELAAGAQVELVFMLGDAASEAEAQALIRKYRDTDVDAVLAGIRDTWDRVLDTVQVHTPNRAMDIVLNDWLPYQTLGCRMWARTAYYQASGAYGFRDQLQDSMALCVSRPDVAREHLLRAAGRQFAEGDVQHWWLPPTGKGIRTKIRDDRLWLPYVAAHYIKSTGDQAVLDEALPFLEGDAVKPDATDAFFFPGVSDDKSSLYEHAARSIDSSLATGSHGLPLMGTGDWNDGMNNVGAQGKGESVWMGWFLLSTIEAFAPFAETRGDGDRAQRWRQHADDLRAALDGEAGWDGEWYRRGYYDDGTPLGTRTSEECRIDVIAQSWSVLANASNRQHAAAAMDAVEKYLVMHDKGIALLLTPPFDRTPKDPGYIKGYPPGIRENGGQYTHGATWSVFALAQLGQGNRAGQLFDRLNPINHSRSAAAIERYRVEPYVACADVYSVKPYVGCGGWTWYTGSAAWIYRAGLEAILGFHLQGDRLLINPCIPRDWSHYEITYCRHGDKDTLTRYEITVENPDHVCSGVAKLELDGAVPSQGAGESPGIALVDDGKTHQVRIVLGNAHRRPE